LHRRNEKTNVYLVFPSNSGKAYFAPLRNMGTLEPEVLKFRFIVEKSEFE
jgi:hypothetical protein